MKSINIKVSYSELLDIFNDIKRLTIKFNPNRIELSHFGVDIKSLLSEYKDLKLVYNRKSIGVFHLNIFCDDFLYKAVDIDIRPLIAFFSELVETNLINNLSDIPHVDIAEAESFEFDLVYHNELWEIAFFISYPN